jgi:hypothetical protein
MRASLAATVVGALLSLGGAAQADEPAHTTTAPSGTTTSTTTTTKTETMELSKSETEAVLASYHALKSPDPQDKKIEKLPAHEKLARIDVSMRIRSASFGHKTWLLVPPGAKKFYVEYGKSTNTPPGFFGPFDVKPVEKDKVEKGERPATTGPKTEP